MSEVRLDRRGVGEMLHKTAARITNDVAGQIARQVKPPPGSGITERDVKVRKYRTDRAAAVDIDHPDALEAQLQHGILTRAAAAVGLGVADR